jgi:ribosomal protein S18 acetylase RimI-like enzyme
MCFEKEKNMNLKENFIPNIEDLMKLYNNVEWSNYTKHPDMLKNAYENSLYVLTAWDENQLIGAIRVVGDGYSIIYIQDLLILREYQHMGVGKKLLTEAVRKYKHVYQKVLLTENDPKTKSFYEKMGFKDSKEYGCLTYVIITN